MRTEKVVSPTSNQTQIVPHQLRIGKNVLRVLERGGNFRSNRIIAISLAPMRPEKINFEI